MAEEDAPGVDWGAALEALVKARPDPPRLELESATRWRLSDESGAHLVVDAGGGLSTIAVEGLPVSLEESEDAAERLDAVLDLVAAWLDGALFVEQEFRGERCVLRRVGFRHEGRTQWIESTRESAGLLSRLGRGAHRVEVCGRAARARRATLPLPRPPWAPWLGWRGESAQSAATARELPIDGELDLHNFSPKEVGRLLRSYIEAAQAAGQLQLRVVHGKGKGVLRRTVHAELARHPGVAHFELAGMGAGSWGATLVRLHPAAGKAESGD